MAQKKELIPQPDVFDAKKKQRLPADEVMEVAGGISLPGIHFPISSIGLEPGGKQQADVTVVFFHPPTRNKR